MERPWLILCCVVRVGPPSAQADAEEWEHPEVVDAEDAPPTQEEEHAAAMDAEAQHAAWVVEADEDALAQEEEDEEHAAAMDAEAQQAAAVEAGEDALAQEEEEEEHGAAMDMEALHAAVGEAEEHVAAVEAAAEAQEGAGHAAVGDAEEDAQAQHAAAGAAEEDPQVAQLEESVVNMNTDAVASELAHAAHGAAEPDFIMSVAPPLRVSFLITGLTSHPNPARPDKYPYIIASGPFCLLANFSMEPSVR